MPVPEPGPGEVLPRVLAVGICGTDASEWADGPVQFPVERRHPATGHVGPLVIGHEFAGQVVGLGDGVDQSWTGHLVASCGAVTRGRCWQCLRGRTNLCVRYSGVGLHRHGALDHYVVTPVANCERVGELGLTPDAAALGQPMAVAVHSRVRSRVEPGEHALVLGVGGIGAMLVYALAGDGVDVTVADPDPDRITLALRLGAQRVAPADGPPEAVFEVMDGPPHVVFEATGIGAVARRALELLPKGGRLVQIGVQRRSLQLDLGRVTLTELEVIGTNAMVRETDFLAALRLVAGREDGWADVAPVAITLDTLVSDGLEPLASGRAGAIKTLVDPWATGTRPSSTTGSTTGGTTGPGSG